jgi:hypothetical protein
MNLTGLAERLFTAVLVVLFAAAAATGALIVFQLAKTLLAVLLPAIVVAHNGQFLWFPGEAGAVALHLMYLGAQIGVALMFAYAAIKLAVSYVCGRWS